MKLMKIILIFVLLLGLTPVEAKSYDTGARFTNLEIISIDITDASSLQRDFQALYKYVYEANDTVDPFSYSYFAINTTAEIWNSLPHEVLVRFYLGGIGLFWSYPENGSYEFEISTVYLVPFVETYVDTLVHVPPGLSSYNNMQVAFLRVNQSGLIDFPKGTYIFQPRWLHPSGILNTTVTVTDTGMEIEYAERPSDWKPGLMHNLPIRFTPESWATFVMSMQVSGVIVVWKRRQRKLEST